jgi:creatine kinase
MAKHLTKEIYTKLAPLKTPNGFTLQRAIQTGVDNPGHPFIMTVGMVAGDEESYDVFADLFDPVIELRHNGYKKTDKHPTDLDPTKLRGGDNLDPKYVISSRVRTGRSIRGLCLPPHCSRSERREVESVVTTALGSLDGLFKGKYYALTSMTEEEQQQLIDDHFLFDKPVSPLLTASRMARDWPDARGIWHNEDKNFLVWVNEEDHTRVISMQKGGNMKEVFTRFCDGLAKFEAAMKGNNREFMWNEHLGFILTCPSNLGTGLRAGVLIKIPLVAKLSIFKDIIEELGLQTRGVGGVDTAPGEGGIFDVSNSDRLGVSEVDLVQKVVSGVEKLIEIEKCLEKNTNIYELLPPKLLKSCKLLKNYPDLSVHNNHMAKCLNPDIFLKLAGKKTVNGFSLDRAIQTGVDNPGHPFIMTVGMVAGDEESYDVFADLFDPVIEARHGGFKKDDVHKTDLDASHLDGGDDLDPNYVLSSRVRTGRSIRGLSLPPFCSRAERREVENIVTAALGSLEGQFKGKYYALKNMTEEEQQQLIDDHFLFDKPVSPLLTASRMARDWPDARGIWHNEDKNFLIWVNEEDHTRVISMQKGGNMKEVFTRFCDGLAQFESAMKEKNNVFMWNPHHGFILTCPSNLGTGLRAGVHLKIPLLSKHEKFSSILKTLRLQKRGTGGVDTAAEGAIFDISNADRLGFSEVELVQNVIDGVKLLIEMEKALEKNLLIDNLIPSIERVSSSPSFPDLSQHNNHMAKCITPKIYAKLSKLKTPNGFTLDRAIQTGVDNPGHPFIMTVGMVAGDEESYDVFADLFDPVIEARHGGFKKTDKHKTDLNPNNLRGGENLDPNYVLSSRVRTGRSIRGFCLPPHCSRSERREVEKIVTTSLATFDGPFKGKYYALTSMTDKEQQQLIDDHFLFDKPVSPLLTASRMARDWPDARGIWHNEDKNFLIWVNEEDHTRVISMQKGGNMKDVFTRFCDGLTKFETAMKQDKHEFMWNEHLGFVLTCPSNLGTGLRAGVHMKIPLLSKHEKFPSILKTLCLQKRGTGGVDTAAEGGIFDISNADRLGFSEVQLVQNVIDGVELLVKMEKALEANQSIEDLIPKPTPPKEFGALESYPDLSKHNNHMAKCLTKEIYTKLAPLKTPNGFSLDRAIQTGVDNPGHPFIMTVGMVAGDEESYDVFADLFDPVIEARHGGFKKTDKHKTDLDPSHLSGGDDLDPNYVLSSRVRTGRSIRGLCLPPHCSRSERREVESIVTTALATFDGPFKGKYYALTSMTDKEQQQLIDDHFLFDKPVSPLLTASRMARDWPDARGIWHNEDKNFLIWVNEEDHTRVISMQKGGNMKEVFTRFCDGLAQFESAMKEKNNVFMWNPHHGFILTCPSNLGTGLRAGVHLKIPLLSKHEKFSSILKTLRLQKRGTGGVDTAAEGAIFDISNADRLGFSEVELVQKVIDGVKLLVQMEKALEAGETIDSLIPSA